MKKFLFICLSIVILVTIAFMTVFLLSSSEVFGLNDNSWKNKSLILGSEHKLEFKLDNAESNTTAEDFKITIANTKVVEVLNENGVPTYVDGPEKNQKLITFNIKAVGAGETTLSVEFNSKNADNIDPTQLTVRVSDGSESSPFKINNFAEFSQIGRKDSPFTKDKNYVLEQDIIMEGEWTPIPGEFTGTFNGNGHKISNIKITNESAKDSAQFGLFETIGTKGSVYSLNIDGFDATGDFHTIGTIAGINKGKCYFINASNVKIENTHTDSKIGGIVGVNQNTDVLNFAYLTLSTFHGTLKSTKNATIGGLVGVNEGSTVGYSYVKQTIPSVNKVTLLSAPSGSVIGGLVGINKYSNKAGLVADSYSLASTDADSTSSVGGIIGSHEYALGQVNKTFGCYYLNDETTKFTMAISGYNDSTDPNPLIISEQHKEKGVYVAKGYSITELKAKANFKSHLDHTGNPVTWDFEKIWKTPTLESTPDFIATIFRAPSESDLLPPATITNITDLFGLDSAETTLLITSDIDCDGLVIADNVYDKLGNNIFNGVPTLTNKTIKSGAVDEAQITISNFSITPSVSNTGLFATLTNCTFENIKFKPNKFKLAENATSADTNIYGVLAGTTSNTTLNNVDIDLTATNFNGIFELSNQFKDKTFEIGGLVGHANSTEFTACDILGKEDNSTISVIAKIEGENKGTINRTTNLGGIVGLSNASNFNNCSSANIVLKDYDESSNGQVAYAGSVGGIVGYVDIKSNGENPTLFNCEIKSGEILSSTYTALSNGGYIKDYGHFVGGIVGSIGTNCDTPDEVYIVDKCVSNATLRGLYVGGIAGKTFGNISRSTSNSTSEGWKVGGIAGTQLNTSIVSNCLIQGKLIQTERYNSGFKLAKSANTYDSGISNDAQVAGISAISIGLISYDEVPLLKNCFVNCEMSGSNQFKDSAINKRVVGEKIFFVADTDNYRSLTKASKIKNCVINTNKASSARDRFAIKDSDDNWVGTIGDAINKYSYDYSIASFNGTNFGIFEAENFDVNIWAINSEAIPQFAIK